MMDKNIPYFDVTMVRKGNIAALGEPKPPKGYSCRFFIKGDEHAWAATRV